MNGTKSDIEGENSAPRRQPSQPTVSVIMPVYNGAHFIDKSLPPLLRMLEQGDLSEVIVVDDSSTDNTSEIAMQMGARVVPSGGRLWNGGARNRGVQEAIGDLMWFVDADVVVHDDAIQHLINGFSEPDVVAVFGSYDDHPPQKNFLSIYKNLVHHYYHQHGRLEVSSFWAGCGAVRKDAFLQVGGFGLWDFKFWDYVLEDVELGYRLRETGGRTLLLAGMQGTHLKEWRFFNLMYTEIFLRALPWSRLMLTQTGTANDLNVGPGERFRAILAGLLVYCMVAIGLRILPWWSLLVMIIITAFANLKLVKLFSRRKGLMFAFGGLLFHQFYYLYSGAAFVWCWFEIHLFKKK